MGEAAQGAHPLTPLGTFKVNLLTRLSYLEEARAAGEARGAGAPKSCYSFLKGFLRSKKCYHVHTGYFESGAGKKAGPG
jgi:hypothetical protein